MPTALPSVNQMADSASGMTRSWTLEPLKRVPADCVTPNQRTESIGKSCPSGSSPFRGSIENNIVAPHCEHQSMQGATVYRDERAPADERYKLWSKFRPTDSQIAEGCGADSGQCTHPMASIGRCIPTNLIRATSHAILRTCFSGTILSNAT